MPRRGESVGIEYGIETYYASAERAEEIESSIARGQLYVVVDLDDDGSARIERLETDLQLSGSGAADADRADERASSPLPRIGGGDRPLRRWPRPPSAGTGQVAARDTADERAPGKPERRPLARAVHETAAAPSLAPPSARVIPVDTVSRSRPRRGRYGATCLTRGRDRGGRWVGRRPRLSSAWSRSSKPQRRASGRTYTRSRARGRPRSAAASPGRRSGATSVSSGSLALPPERLGAASPVDLEAGHAAGP